MSRKRARMLVVFVMPEQFVLRGSPDATPIKWQEVR
jgi:hypothetical protein